MDALLVEINYPRILAYKEYMVDFDMTIVNSLELYQTWIVGQIHTVQVGLDYRLRRFEVDISETIITPDSSVDILETIITPDSSDSPVWVHGRILSWLGPVIDDKKTIKAGQVILTKAEMCLWTTGNWVFSQGRYKGNVHVYTLWLDAFAILDEHGLKGVTDVLETQYRVSGMHLPSDGTANISLKSAGLPSWSKAGAPDPLRIISASYGGRTQNKEEDTEGLDGHDADREKAQEPVAEATTGNHLVKIPRLTALGCEAQCLSAEVWANARWSVGIQALHREQQRFARH
ncbi:hypothetical protein B0H19DRAFT_1074760 [Mycena capillaripes]|nr:hypothetical protein B0H19DRAFT_1074760 [Mycena capillaripes]